jgi:threonine dehydrogenase-like Zn-dependent dehydrogenase
LAETLKGLNQLARSWPPEPTVKRCAVVGAGSIGHLCARVLAHKGHEVTSFDRDAQRRNYFLGSRIKTSDDLSQLAGFDVLVEASGDAGALNGVIRQSPPGATILVMGRPHTQHQLSLRDITAFDKTVVGSAGSGSQEYEEALRLLPYLDLNAYLQCVLPLDEYQQAWEFVRQGKHLKVFLYPKGDLP